MIKFKHLSEISMENYFVTANNIKLRYQMAGTQGSIVILIHGLGGATENWELNLLELSKSHRVYALDLPGFGQSEKPKIRYTLPFVIQTFIAFLNQLNLQKVR